MVGPVHACDWQGPGDNVLLLHGMAAHTHWWDEVVPHWKGRLRAVALDFRGHGDSRWLSGERYTSDRYLEDIELVRRELGWRRFLLVAHSMGARVALDYARSRGEFLRGVVAIDFLTDFIPSSRDHKFGKAQARSRPVYPDEDAILSKFRLQPTGTLLGKEDIRRLGRHSIRQGPGGWSWKFDWNVLSFPYGSVWPQLPQLNVEALIVRGEHSAILPREMMNKVAAALPRGRALEIAEAHHHIPLDRPKELAEALASYAAGLHA